MQLQTVNKGRYLALDGMRGIAALFVVFFHIRWQSHCTDTQIIRNGYLAVDLFFMLSGFVIAANYSKKIVNYATLQDFVYLRFFRIYPLHIITLLALVCFEFLKLAAYRSGAVVPDQVPFTDSNSSSLLAANIFLLHGLGMFKGFSWNTPSWSISSEFAAYFLFAIAAWVGLLRSRLFFAIGTIVAIFAYCAVAISSGTLDAPDRGLIRCFAGFFLGIMLYEFSGNVDCKLRRVLSIWPDTVVAGCEFGAIVGLLAAMSFASGAGVVVLLPFFLILIVLLQLDRGPVAVGLMSPPVQLLGRFSYSIYMVHIPILIIISTIMKRFLGVPVVISTIGGVPTLIISAWSGDLLILGTIILVLGTAYITHALVEDPGRLFGRRLVAARRNALNRLTAIGQRVE
jgi:peptidoglycan/LPS O-acetylase OafA/YrhL